MAEVQGAPPGGDTAPKPESKLAGKFESPEALAKGINEIRGKLGAEPLANVIGEGGTYKDANEAATGYKELERVLGGLKPAKTLDPKTPVEPLKLGEASEAEADVPQILTKAGLVQADLEKQWLEHGELTDEQYAAIHKARPSLTKGDVKLIASGMAAQAVVRNQAVAATVSEAEKIVGGTEQLKNLLNSAGQFITDKAEQADFNRRLADPKLAVGAVRDLAARHAAEVGAGRSQPLITGGSPAGPALPKNLTEFNVIIKKAARGDASAMATLNAVPQSTIDKWTRDNF